MGTKIGKNLLIKTTAMHLLIFSPQKSPDGESSYASAKYMITQNLSKPITAQKKFNSDKTALGMGTYR